MSNVEVERLREKQRELEGQLSTYMERSKQDLNEVLRRGQEQYRAYLTGQIEVLQNQMKSAISAGNDMMIGMYKMMLDTYFGMLGQYYSKS
jgi:hypothetical protein